MEPAISYACLCCGYRTLAAPPPGSYIVCPICVWEDLPPHLHQPKPYCVALRRAQRTFLALGVCDARHRALARPATAHDQRPTGWQPIDVQVERIEQQIRSAFAGVAREDGITIHEADVLDDYGTDEQMAAARRLDTEQHWTEVPDATIARQWTALSFLDPKGFHYYLPAYMCWALRSYDSSVSNSLDWLLYALAIRPWDHDESGAEGQMARFGLLSAEQAQTVCRFLEFLSDYGYPCADVEMARRGLDQYWGQFRPESDSGEHGKT